MAQRSLQMIGKVEQTYATSLLELVLEQQGDLDEITDEVRQLRTLIEDQSSLAALLGSQILSVEERASAIEKIFAGRISDLLYRFVQVVNQKQRLGVLGGILHAFVVAADEHRGIIEVDAYVPTALDDAAAANVAAGVGEAVGKQVTLHQHEDASLIGGLKLRIGDQLLDGSVAARLRLMKGRMIEEGKGRGAGA